MSDNWIVSNLESALSGWNEKLSEIWTLLTQSPETFKGGTVWTMILNINDALVGIGYGLLVLFFAMGVAQSAAGQAQESVEGDTAADAVRAAEDNAERAVQQTLEEAQPDEDEQAAEAGE